MIESAGRDWQLTVNSLKCTMFGYDMRIATTKVERHDTEGALKVVKASYETARAHLLKACEEWGKRKDEKANQEVEEARTVLVGAGYSKMVETLGSGTTESVHRVLIELFVGGQYHEDVE